MFTREALKQKMGPIVVGGLIQGYTKKDIQRVLIPLMKEHMGDSTSWGDAEFEECFNLWNLAMQDVVNTISYALAHMLLEDILNTFSTKH